MLTFFTLRVFILFIFFQLSSAQLKKNH